MAIYGKFKVSLAVMVAYSKSLVEEKKMGGKSLWKLCEHMVWLGLDAVYDF